jgi:hypothetical protein
VARMARVAKFLPSLVVLFAGVAALPAEAAAHHDQAKAAETSAVWHGSSPTLRLIAGSTKTVAHGETWQPDAGFALGGEVRTVAHSSGGKLFTRARYGVHGYRVHVPKAGHYQVTIGDVGTATAQRAAFSVDARSATSTRVVSARGAVTAYSRTTVVTVKGHTLTLSISSARRLGIAYLILTRLTKPPVASTPTPTASSTPGGGSGGSSGGGGGGGSTGGGGGGGSAPVTTPTPTITPTPTVSATPTAPPVITGTELTPANFGAVGNGVTDDSTALQNFFNAGGPNVTLVLPAGSTYAHSRVLTITKAGTHLTGSGTLLATAEATSSVWVQADNVTIDGGVVLRTASTTQRWTAYEQMGLRLDGHSGATIRNVTIDGSAAAGLYVGGAQNFTLDHVTVENTRADGIHMTDGSGNGTVIDPTTSNTGDDGIAVVSYKYDGTPCHDITVTGADVNGTTWGRGMSVVGGTNISYSNFTVSNSSSAAVYVAAEGSPYYTFAPVNITVSNGSLAGSNTSTSVQQGAVLVNSDESDVTPTNVTVSNVSISATRHSAPWNVGVVNYGLAPVNITLDNISITGGPSAAYGGNAPSSSVHTSSWTVNGSRAASFG